MKKQAKKTKKNFNESFVDAYNNSSLSAYDLEPKIHAEVPPAYADAIAKAKSVRERMKDEFKEQDKLVKDFLEAQDLDENPKIKSNPRLKAMKLAENRMSGKGKRACKKTITESDMGERDRIFREVLHEYHIEDAKNHIESYCDWKDLPYDEVSNIVDFDKLATMFEDRQDSNIAENDTWDEVINQYMKNVDLGGLFESLKNSVELKKNKPLNEDYSNYIGKPLKDFLSYICRNGQNNPRISLEYENNSQGMSGYSGVASDAPWYSSDKVVKDVFVGDGKYYDFKVITESLKEARKVGSTGGIEGFQYNIVTADANNKHKKITKAKGVEKLIKAIAKLDDKTLNDAGKTQLYAYRDGENPDNPIYFKVSNDDGTWDVLVDEIEKERPVEDRKTLYNCVNADLISGSEKELERLRKVPREEDGIGFDAEEIGFRDDTFVLNTVSDKSIQWAKKVASAYGLKTSDVVEKDNGRKYIQIYAPGATKEMMAQK